MTMMDSLEIIADLTYCLSPCGHFKNVQLCSNNTYEVSVFRTVGPLVLYYDTCHIATIILKIAVV